MYLTPAIQPFINQTLVEGGGTLAVILAIASKPFILSQHSTITSSDTGSATRIRIACTLHSCTPLLMYMENVCFKEHMTQKQYLHTYVDVLFMRIVCVKEHMKKGTVAFLSSGQAALSGNSRTYENWQLFDRHFIPELSTCF